MAGTNLALITGASSGIGLELAKLHAPHGDLLLVARRKDRLDTLAEDLAVHGHTVHTVAADLSRPEGVQAVIDYCAAHDLDVEVLINNAGFGARAPFVELPLDRQLEMVDLNIKALVELTYACLPAMLERGSGRILQIGSTAGWLPGPNQATYYASKAFVNSFSRALHEEIAGTGVTCTVLCPGPVVTEFGEVSGSTHTRAFKAGAITAERTAKAGYKAMMKGKDVQFVPASMGPLLGRLTPLMPRRLVTRISKKAMEEA